MSNFDVVSSRYVQSVQGKVPSENGGNNPKMSFGDAPAPSYGEGSYERGQEGMSTMGKVALAVGLIGAGTLAVGYMGNCSALKEAAEKAVKTLEGESGTAAKAKAAGSYDKFAEDIAGKEIKYKKWFGLGEGKEKLTADMVKEHLSEEKFKEIAGKIDSTASKAADAAANAAESAVKTADNIKPDLANQAKKNSSSVASSYAGEMSREELFDKCRKLLDTCGFKQKAGESNQQYAERFLGQNHGLSNEQIKQFREIMNDVGDLLVDAGVDNARQQELKKIAKIVTGGESALSSTFDRNFEVRLSGLVKSAEKDVPKHEKALEGLQTKLSEKTKAFEDLFKDTEIFSQDPTGARAKIFEAFNAHKDCFEQLAKYRKNQISFDELKQTEGIDVLLSNFGINLNASNIKSILNSIAFNHTDSLVQTKAKAMLKAAEDMVVASKNVADKEKLISDLRTLSDESGWRAYREEYQSLNAEIKKIKEDLTGIRDGLEKDFKINFSNASTQQAFQAQLDLIEKGVASLV